MTTALPSTLFSRVTRLAGDRRVHSAFRWFHLNDGRLMEWQAAMVAIPAPPFGEDVRALWLAERFSQLGLTDIHIDDVGNVIAYHASAHGNANIFSEQPLLLISAHIDTVFPAGTPIDPHVDQHRLTAPGACDNAAGVTGMLAIAAALKATELSAGCGIVFAGNVGEEGEGDLRGMRHIYAQSAWSSLVSGHIILDGAGDQVAVIEALGSKRFAITVRGPGGHSWSDAGAPNPIAVLSEIIVAITSLPLPVAPRTTMNVGTIEGGSAVNAVPEYASARFDLRSTSAEELQNLEAELLRIAESVVKQANARATDDSSKSDGLTLDIQRIGDRPAGKLAHDAPILDTLRAVDRHLGLHTQLRLASTDANIPLSIGVPALSLGAGGDGGGIHTRNEWFDASHRELALKRILLLLLAFADHVSELTEHSGQPIDETRALP